MEKSQNQIVFSVSDLISVVNQTLEYAYPDVYVEGEVTEYKVSQNKWVYFNLKDDTGSVGCFMTVWQVRMPITDGMKVIVSAAPKLTNFGKFSLTIKSIKPSGEGSIKKSFEILRAKLEGEGLFAIERKRALPKIPSSIAVISSTQAAGYADFIKILNDRWGGIKISVAHVQVQGESAPDQIIKAIEYFNQLEHNPDVIAIIRGGGSADDLSAFNDEKLVRAIAGSRVPTIVGVGHEVDESLADLAADVRAATPSNAAQLLVPDKNEIIRAVKYQVKSILPKVDSSISAQIDNTKLTILKVFEKIETNIDIHINQVQNMQGLINQLNPLTILARGYALIKGQQKVGQIIEIETNKNIMKAEVKNVSIK